MISRQKIFALLRYCVKLIYGISHTYTRFVSMDFELERECCIRGYHVYREIWEAAVGEVLTCEREAQNENDRYAVAVKKDGVVIGHLPRKVSRVCSLFIRRGGRLCCTVTGIKRYSADLPQGGLEIPCCPIFYSAKAEDLTKLKRVWKL